MKYKDTVEKLAKEYHLEEKLKDLFPIIESFDKRNELFTILNNDVKTANNAAKLQPADQYLRRTVIRTTFAMIEGLLNILNQAVLDYYKGGFAQLTPDEIEDLTEEKRKKNGELTANFMRTSKKITFSFNLFAQKIGGFSYSIDTTTNEWTQFEKAIRIRNRITHPRNLEDMILNEEEMSSILDVAKWFVTLYIDLENRIGNALSKKNSIESLIQARIKGIQSGKK